MTALIKRVESARGEDRHLDAYIFAAFHREPIEPAKSWSVLDKFQFTFTDGRKNALYVHEDDVPAYSSSLDAAVSLCERVLPDVSFSVTSHVTDSGRRGACEMWRWTANKYEEAREHNRLAGHEHFHQNVGHCTPALALVLAVLRAVG